MRPLSLKTIAVYALALLVSCSRSVGTEEANSLHQTDFTASSGTTIAMGGQTTQISGSGQIVQQGAAQNAGLMWVQSSLPESDFDGSLIVNNVFEINGVQYDVATIHSSNESSMTYTLNDLDVVVDAVCFDSRCEEYVVSVILYRNNSPLIQNLVYVDFSGYNVPVFKANSGSYLMSINNFIQSYLY